VILGRFPRTSRMRETRFNSTIPFLAMGVVARPTASKRKRVGFCSKKLPCRNRCALPLKIQHGRDGNMNRGIHRCFTLFFIQSSHVCLTLAVGKPFRRIQPSPAVSARGFTKTRELDRFIRTWETAIHAVKAQEPYKQSERESHHSCIKTMHTHKFKRGADNTW